MTTSATVRMKRSAKGLAFIAASALTIASCGGDGETSTDSAAPESAEVTISGAWARTSPMSVTVGAVYMDITSAIDDELLGASVDVSIAGTVEIHETVAADMSGDGGMPGEEGEQSPMTGDTMAGDMTGDSMAENMSGDMSGDMAGQMTMRPVGSIMIPAGETVMLMPGGIHIMLLDLAAPLEVGQTFDITLTFANAGSVVVTVEVRDETP